jgi:pimeloyl-ACP methyl ester carboxylesterase
VHVTAVERDAPDAARVVAPDAARAAPVTVLVHGAVDTGASFAEVLRHLPAVRTVTYDRRGCGSAWQLLTPALTLGDHVDDLIDVIDGRLVTVVGHSLGGLVAIGAALRRPDLVRSVGVYETAMPWTSWWTPDERRAMLAEIEANSARALRRAGIDPAETARRRTEWEACRQEVSGLFTEPFRWRELVTPLTVGVGSASTSNSARDSRLIAGQLQAGLMEFPGAGHLAHRTHPELFARLVMRSVRRGSLLQG